MIDALEARRLLSASLDDGVLTVESGRGNDRIEVCVEGDTVTVEIRANGRPDSRGNDDEFDLDDVEEIVIKGGQGNDRIIVCDEVELDVTIEGGKGDDTIVGGSGDDDIEGGPGNDDIDAGAGADHIEGGPGNDRIRGGPGADTAEGGPGDDDIITGSTGSVTRDILSRR